MQDPFQPGQRCMGRPRLVNRARPYRPTPTDYFAKADFSEECRRVRCFAGGADHRTGTLYLIQLIAREMVARREGKILITGSIAGFMPGTFQAVYNGTKALLDSFSYGLREELKDTGVTVTCLMPLPTETELFARAGLMDETLAAQHRKIAEPGSASKQ